MIKILVFALFVFLLIGCANPNESEKDTENCEVKEDSCKNLCNDYQTDKEDCLTRCYDNYYLCRSNN